MLPWKIAALVVVAGAGALAPAFDTTEVELLIGLRALERRAPDGRGLVIVAGNSLVQAALGANEGPTAVHTDRQVAWALTQGGLRIEAAEDVFDRVIALRPELLLFEVDSFFQVPAKYDFWPLRSIRWAARLWHRLSDHGGKAIRAAWLSALGLDPPTSTTAPAPASQRRAKRGRRPQVERWAMRSWEHGAGLRLLRRARAAGIRVGLLEISLFESPESPPPPGFLDERRARAKEILGPGEPYLYFPPLPQAEQYADGRHLGAGGRAIFQAWLTSALSAP